MPDTARLSGLSSADAARRLRDVGPNVLPAPATTPVWRQFVAELTHFFAAMLWVAGVLAIVGGLPELGIAIFIVIVVNAVFAFAQEYRAEQAAARLKSLLPLQVTVVRDGSPLLIDADGVVPDDLVVLADGDRIAADMTCVESHGLLVDTSTMTGESVPESIGAGDRLRAGTFVVEGEGRAIVTATGSSTEFARIAVLTQGTVRPDTPLTRELHRLVRTIALIALASGGAFFMLTLLLDTSASDAFVFAIGITVALVPEGLLPTVTLSLAIGAQRMADQHALVRRLESVETLGSTTFICTDKTGTLTQNRMRIVEVWTPVGTLHRGGTGYEPDGALEPTSDGLLQSAIDVAAAASACSTGRAVRNEDGRWTPSGDPMEAAIDSLAQQLVADHPLPLDALVARFAFDPRRRRSSVATADRVVVKGAPDAVLERCRDDEHTITATRHSLQDLSDRGLRVLAVAARPVDGPPPTTADEAEADLDLLGLLAFEDPPRLEAHDALAACRRAGIGVAMITGDSPLTATAIADETGLRPPDGLVLIGADLPDDEQLLGALVDRDGVVIARVTPEDKLRIARALRARGHVIAMTGDGVNDGPALREADIGIAMGASGSDVAREAADLVLLDDNFATIVAAVEQGRATFANARRFLTYHLTDNVAELFPLLVWSLSGGRIPLALGVLQILALDLATDTLSAVALGSEPARPSVMRQGPVKGRLFDRITAWRAFGVLGPLEALSGFGAFLVVLGLGGWRIGDPAPEAALLASASGAYFLVVVTTQTANAFACRSTRRAPWQLGWCANRLLCIAVTVEFVAALAMLWTPLAHALGQADPGPVGWALAAAAAVLLVLVDAGWKAVRGRRSGPDVGPAGPS